MTPSKLIVANWKMNGSFSLLDDCLSDWQTRDLIHDLVLCPPFTLLDKAHKAIRSKKISLGGQDCHSKPLGAFTGDISASHLKEVGCAYVILGHSERRLHHGEANELVKAKAECACEFNIKPIICVGENLFERNQGKTLGVLKEQLLASMPSLNKEFLIAYEPLWAIGTGKAASLRDIEEVHLFLREEVGPLVPLLYGGSVTSQNYKDILSLPGVEGVLVGGASLKKEDFGRMLCHQ